MPPVPLTSDVALLERRGDPLLREAGAPAPVLVRYAAEVAETAATDLSHARREARYELDPVGENADTDALTEAWLRIDEANVLARLVITEPRAPEPVSVDVQRRALEGRVPPGELHLHVPGTGERPRIRVYDNTGRMRPEAVREVSWALRDRRNDRARTVEPRLVAIMYLLGQWYDAPLEVISGYRIGGLNASETSRHATGRACDIRINRVGVLDLARTVEQRFANVGVGYYPTSAFVHVDVRASSYYWIDRSAPGQRSRTRARTVTERATGRDDVTLRSPHVTERELYIPPVPSAE